MFYGRKAKARYEAASTLTKLGILTGITTSAEKFQKRYGSIRRMRIHILRATSMLAELFGPFVRDEYPALRAKERRKITRSVNKAVGVQERSITGAEEYLNGLEDDYARIFRYFKNSPTRLARAKKSQAAEAKSWKEVITKCQKRIAELRGGDHATLAGLTSGLDHLNRVVNAAKAVLVRYDKSTEVATKTAPVKKAAKKPSSAPQTPKPLLVTGGWKRKGKTLWSNDRKRIKGIREINIWVRPNRTGKLRVTSKLNYHNVSVSFGGFSLVLKRARKDFYAANLTVEQALIIEARQ